MLLHVDFVGTGGQHIFHLLFAANVRLSVFLPNAFLNTVELLLLVFFVAHVCVRAHRVQLVVVVFVDFDVHQALLSLVLDPLEILVFLVNVLLSLCCKLLAVITVDAAAVVRDFA